MSSGEAKRKGLAYAASPIVGRRGDAMAGKSIDAANAGHVNAPGNPPTKKKAKSAANHAGGAPKSILANAAAAYRPSPPHAAFTQDAALSLKHYIEHPAMWGGKIYHENEAKKRVWQLRCTGGPRVRIVAAAGHTPLFALAKIVLEVFQVPKGNGKAYVPALSKGWAPHDSYWSALRHCPRAPGMASRDLPTAAAGLFGTKTGVHKHAGLGAPFFDDWKKIKLYHLMRRRGDALTYHWPDSGAPECFPIAVRLDGIDSNDIGNGYFRTPRLVGANSLHSHDWNDITVDFISNKPPEAMIVMAGHTDAEVNEIVARKYTVPKFDHRGTPMKGRGEYEGGLREMHEIAIQPFVECEMSSIAKRAAAAAAGKEDGNAEHAETSDADGGSEKAPANGDKPSENDGKGTATKDEEAAKGTEDDYRNSSKV